MIMLLVEHIDTNKSLDQIVMFVPQDFDHAKVLELARELGIDRPNIRLQMDMPAMIAPQLAELVGPYAAYCR